LPEPTTAKDPYQSLPEDVAEPPRSLSGILQRIGPGMILAASIVGSGELIATTVLGAKVGYTALWVVILSCFIKAIIQAEMGRYTIASGETGLEALNQVPGPRLGVNWIVWAWAVMVLFTLLQVGAMFGGVAQVLNLIVPGVSVNVWVLLLLALTLMLLLSGGYERIERLSLIKVGLFTMLTLLAAIVLLRMPQYFQWSDLRKGFQLGLSGEGLTAAIAVFGITGVGASELFMYPYWCVEKGYARFAGKREATPVWLERARGWVHVMHVDILASMFIYTVATLAFYLLGAGVLHGMGVVPAEKDMIPVLSRIYTETLGAWSLWLFYLGAIATLYGTIFAATAANSRVYSDMCRLMGLFAREDYARRVAWRRGFVVFLTIVPVCLYLWIESPVNMVLIGGVAQAIMLPIVAIGTLYLHHRRLPREIAPTRGTTVFLWVASLIIICLMSYYAYTKLNPTKPNPATPPAKTSVRGG
jgi:manganese transport protein